MINVLFTNIDKCFAASTWEEYLEKMPLNLKNYVLKYQKKNDRLRVLCGKLLLQKALYKMKQEALIENIQLDTYKRPFILGDIDFNISHSGSYVVLALSISQRRGNTLCKVGIDVEKKRDVNYDEFERVFTAAELQTIKENINPIDKFFEFWTMKEAVMKADGRGFHLPPASFTVINNMALVDNNTWHLTKIFLDADYDCHLATETKNSDIKVEDVVF